MIGIDFFFWVNFSILQNIPNMYLILLHKKMKTNKLKYVSHVAKTCSIGK